LSLAGRGRICSMISETLTPAIYSVDLPAQAGFSPSRIMHHASRRP
jgi:hypothetical protein